MARTGIRNKRPALDERGLRDLALGYAGRYATSREKLIRYLDRKLRERGWEGKGVADPAALATEFARLGYVDDAAYARMKGEAMERRGLGAARIRVALTADGIAGEDRDAALDKARRDGWQAAEILAKRKRIGPFAAESADPRLREKHLAIFLRAGHDMATARAWASAAPGEFPERSD
ncbi:MAG: RecX family transcriptional regulator [Sphingobium sp.]